MYLLVSRQSICILSSIFLYHRFLTASAVWWSWGLSPLAILLSHLSTQIRCADSVISILYSRFLAASSFPSFLLKLASPLSSRYFSRSFFARFHNLVTHTLVHLFRFFPCYPGFPPCFHAIDLLFDSRLTRTFMT